MNGGVRRCARCAETLSLEGRPSRGATCPKCGAYLHSCVNCALYCPGRHNDCREPQAEHVGDKRSANFCDFFRFREAAAGESGDRAGTDRVDDPGRRPSPSDGKGSGGGRNSARDRFDKLFGK